MYGFNNESFLKLPESYLFSEIGTRIKRFKNHIRRPRLSG